MNRSSKKRSDDGTLKQHPVPTFLQNRTNAITTLSEPEIKQEEVTPPQSPSKIKLTLTSSKKKLASSEKVNTATESKRRAKPEEVAGPSSNRAENSLASITKKFLSYKGNGEVLNLNDIAEKIGVKKRRLYDITNVLEGVSVIEKIGKNSIKFIKRDDAMDNQRKELRKSNEELANKETEIDEMIDYCRAMLKITHEDPISQTYAYLKKPEIEKAIQEDVMTLIVKQSTTAQTTMKAHVEQSKFELSFKSTEALHAMLTTRNNPSTFSLEPVQKDPRYQNRIRRAEPLIQTTSLPNTSEVVMPATIPAPKLEYKTQISTPGNFTPGIFTPGSFGAITPIPLISPLRIVTDPTSLIPHGNTMANSINCFDTLQELYQDDSPPL